MIFMRGFRHSSLYKHADATDITRAKILEIADHRYGLPEMRETYLREGRSDWLPLIVPPGDAQEIIALQWIGRLCGIVDSDTTFEFLRFEVIQESGLSEGRLVEARIGDHRSVLFQLIEGITHEEVVQQKNKYGYARAKARKIGRWDLEQQRFCHVPWLPSINAPVFLVDDAEFAPHSNNIGHFPRTAYGVSLDMREEAPDDEGAVIVVGDFPAPDEVI